MAPYGEGGPTPEQMGIRPAAESGKKYYDHAVVNGIQIEVRWDDTNNDYLIYFPQVKYGDEARERGVKDQIIRLTNSPEIARNVFHQAKKIAERTTDVYNVARVMQDYIQSFESR